MERSYIAFISYKHAERDAAIAKQVHTLIENYIIPRSLRQDGKKLGIVFRDEEELPISSDLTESICTALDASRYLIVICSPEAKKSPWVAREVQYFLQHHDPGNAFVVLADGEPRDVFPRALTHILNKETGEYQDVEPLALDVRADTIPAAIKKTKAQIKKLYAGMLGCSYDNLVQREKARRMKRFGAAAALCLMLAGCFTGMLLMKNRELTRKNQQLTEAIDLSLRREADLLSRNAEAALENGDAALAMRYAADALYSSEVDRPYFAPAERMLFQAMDVLGEKEDGALLAKIALPHHAPIQMMSYNGDGSALYTIDVYGSVSCFDAVSGSLLWETKLEENNKGYFSDIAKAQLWHDEKAGIVACYYDGAVTGLDAVTGCIAWKTVIDLEICNGIYFDGVGQQLAFIGKKYSSVFRDANAMTYHDYYFFALSTQDGGRLHAIPLLQLASGASMYNRALFGGYSNALSGGMFSGSDRFVGTVFKTENNISETLLYVIDLPGEEVSFIKNEGLSAAGDYLHTFCIGDDRALVASRKENNFVRLQCFDLKQGSLLWENAADFKGYVPLEGRCHVMDGQSAILLTVEDGMMVFDRESGELLASARTDGQIIALHAQEKGLFSYAQADGYCAVGWKNESGLHDSGFFSVTIDLPDTPEVLFYKGGLIRGRVGDVRIEGFDILPLQEGGGSVAYLSEDRCTVYVASALSNPVLPEAVIFQGEAPFTEKMGDFLDENPGGQALLGPVFIGSDYCMHITDIDTHSYAVTGNVSGYNDYHLAADGKQLLVCSQYGNICRIGLDGSMALLSQRERVQMNTRNGMNSLADRFRADAVRLSADGRVLSARCDEYAVTYWLDGEGETSVPVPDDVRVVVSDDIERYFMIHTGKNGLIILSDFASDQSNQLGHFAVYDLQKGKWTRIPDAANGLQDRLIAAGEKLPVFAVYDDDRNIRVYDGKTASMAQCIYVGMPLVSMQKIGMLLDDQYVYVLTKDGQLMIYDMESHERVFRKVFEANAQNQAFSVWMDRENSRLYLGVGNQGLCVDFRSWEELFSIQDFRYYSTVRNEVYVCRYELEDNCYRLMAIPIPTTDQLIDIALDTLP